MFNRTSLQVSAALASISLVAGCGVFSEDGGTADQKITVGTTSAPSSLDPAAAWDGSWELYRNVYQTLLSFPTGSVSPQPDAADCKFDGTSSQVFRCELHEGLKFSNGDELDAAAVKHSFDRIIKIDSPTGPAGLLGSLKSVKTEGDRVVVFQLKEPDATFPFILAAPAMSIVDPKDYPADKLRTGNEITGSGPYVLDGYEKKKKAELSKNPNYKGFADRKNNSVTIEYFEDSDTMVTALKDKRIDVIYRGLTASEVVDLQGKKGGDSGINLVESTGADIRYLVFNAKDPAVRKLPVRQAIAQVIDRGALVSTVYKGTAEPLYSMVPKGISGHTTSYFDRYGEPDPAKARRTLRAAGITEPVALTLGYTTDRYGSSTKAEFTEIKRQLEASGLFKVTLQGAPWDTFQESYGKGEYPVFGRGWFPDFPDPDNFIAPFVGKQNALKTPYENAKITKDLLPDSRRMTVRKDAADVLKAAQEALVDDTRLLPLWQGKLYVAGSEEIAGSERALDPQTVMQMWEFQRKASW
ncbi:ABC transporter substrate-binding protein [Streptomyces sp. NPDC001941]|uniref:ABC transporter substrate-binding protein n=1 Tax=Streptomyces sp. NPDC001941 TaxID=3154659 RepID=UPI00332AB46C